MARRQIRGKRFGTSGLDARNITRRISRRAERGLENARETIINTQDRMRKYVESNPEKALLIAAGIGAAFGAALTAFFRPNRRGR